MQVLLLYFTDMFAAMRYIIYQVAHMHQKYSSCNPIREVARNSRISSFYWTQITHISDKIVATQYLICYLALTGF